jgi:hypothetical protein
MSIESKINIPNVLIICTNYTKTLKQLYEK